jgi:hypothetical protein
VPRPLPGLPGSESDPGTGPVSPALLDALLDDAALLTLPVRAAAPGPGDAAGDRDPQPDPDVEAALERHRRLRTHPGGELLLGPLLVPTGLADTVILALRSHDHALPVVLVPDPGPGSLTRQEATPQEAARRLAAAQHARNLLLDDDRAEVVGVELDLPGTVPAQAAARAVVDALDFTVPAWLRPAAGTDWERALDVLAEDGAEGLALAAAGPDALADHVLAALLRAAVDRELTVRAVGGPLPLIRPPAATGAGTGAATGAATVAGTAGPDSRAHGVLNLVCAVRAALNGAAATELAGILAATEPAPLLSALRRMSDADSAVVRAFLAAVPVAPVATTLAELDARRLLPSDAR